MRNQFAYTRKERTGGTDEVPEYKYYKDSINIAKVIRAVEFGEALVIVMDDIHDRSSEVPNIDTKNNRHLGMKKKVDTLQTEVYLHGEDIDRWFKLTCVEE